VADGLEEAAQQPDPARTPGRRRHLVSLRGQLRQQLLPDRPGRPGHEYPHHGVGP
jgi:hypothetical protein